MNHSPTRPTTATHAWVTQWQERKSESTRLAQFTRGKLSKDSTAAVPPGSANQYGITRQMSEAPTVGAKTIAHSASATMADFMARTAQNTPSSPPVDVQAPVHVRQRPCDYLDAYKRIKKKSERIVIAALHTVFATPILISSHNYLMLQMQ
jgi:hypothetical protein